MFFILFYLIWLKMKKYSSIQFYSKNIQVFYSHNKHQFKGGVKTNVAIAAFVTTQGRLHIYEEL